MIRVLNREQSTAVAYLIALETRFREMIRGEVNIVAGSTLIEELLESRLDALGKQLYQQMRACSHFELIEQTAPAESLAAALRGACERRGEVLTRIDSINIALGQLSKCDEIWTCDKKLVSKWERHLLSHPPIRFPHTVHLPPAFPGMDPPD